MTVTRTNRFSLHRWDSGADAFNRAQNDSDNVQIETLGAIFKTGVVASIGAASSSANVRSFYYATDQNTLYFSDGTNWVALNDLGEVGDITTITPDASASAGTVTTSGGFKIGEIALANHVHAIATTVPVAIGTSLAEGVGTSFARADHVHELGVGSIEGANQFVAGVVDNTALKSTSGSEAVNTNVIRDNAITTSKIGAKQVTTAKIADSAVDSLQLASNAVINSKILDGTILPIKLNSTVAGNGLASTSGVLSVNVDNSTIEINADTLRIKNDAITTLKILDANVTGVKLASAVAGAGLVKNVSGNLDVVGDSTITVSANSIGIASQGVGTVQIADSAVDSLQIKDNAVITTKILDANVTGVKLASAVAGAGLVQNVSGNLDVVGDSTITVSANSIGIASKGVGTAQIDDYAVQALQIGANAVTNGKILDGTIQAAKLNFDVAGDGLASTSGVLSVKVDNATIEFNVSKILRIKDGAITTAKIGAEQVTAAKVGAGVYRNAINGNVGGQVLYGTGAAPTGGTYTNGDLYFRYNA